MVSRFLLILSLLLATSISVPAAETNSELLARVQQSLAPHVPRLLCLDAKIATGGQPDEEAYAKAKANGFRAVLSLRTAREGIDLQKERKLVEASGLRYFSVPVAPSSPKAAQVDEFLRIMRDGANHPVLVNCASGSRVGAFIMILRVIDHGWSREKALDEAHRIGMRGATLQRFAEAYFVKHGKNK